jgi:hypothetical protein
MRTITLSDGREMGTNDNTGGIFCRKTDGTWGQWAGTGQTPRFRTAAHFRRWLNRYNDGLDGFAAVRTVAKTGWE